MSLFKLSQITIIASILMLLTPLSHAVAKDPLQLKQSLTTEQLQWALMVPDHKWSNELQHLARLLEDKQEAEAAAYLDKWLEGDIHEVLSVLPIMNEFFFRFTDNSLPAIYSKHLARFSGPERINMLAMLNLKYRGVNLVGSQVLIDWWEQDSESLKQWILQTPCFFEELYFNDLMTTILSNPVDFQALASFLFSLHPQDTRRARFFNKVIDQWMSSDSSAAEAFVLNLYESNQHKQIDDALDLVASVWSHKVADRNDFKDTLNWLSRIKNTELREHTSRDAISSIEKEIEKQHVLTYLKSNPIKGDKYRKDIEAHLSTVGANTQAVAEPGQ